MERESPSPLPARNPTERWVRLAAVCGFLAVALGAFGAHGLKDHLVRTGATEWWQKAVLYHLAHSAVALACALVGRTRPVLFFLLGVLFFSGSLYVMSITGQRWLGAVTPVGGVLFLVGWFSLVLQKAPPASRS